MAAYAEELKDGESENYTYTFTTLSNDYVKIDLKVNDVFTELPTTGRIYGWETGDA